MQWLDKIRTVLRRPQLEADMDDELRFHLEKQTEHNIARGMGPKDARNEAMRQFGNVGSLKEECRDTWGVRFISEIGQDIRYGLRQLRRNPGFTIVAVLTLALGIGANTAIFSVVNTVLLRPLPYKNPDRLVTILHYGDGPVSPANFLDWQKQNHVFERMSAAEWWSPNLTGADKSERLWGLRVTSNTFALLGIQPLLGRTFTPDEDKPGRQREVVLSFRMWQRQFGGKASVIGKSITLEGRNYTVIGVMPRGFKFAPFWAVKAELWAPLPLAERASNRHANSLRAFARLEPGTTLKQARADMATITNRLEKEYPGTNRHITVTSLMEKVVGNIRPALLLLLGAVGFVLLIACANVAHMLLARAATRQKEVSVRTALGASRARITLQFLTESLLLTFFGAALGLLLASWCIRFLVALNPAGVPRIETLSLDSHVVAFTLIASVLVGLACGLAPALQTSAINLNSSLKEGGRTAAGGGHRNRVQNLLVMSEFALALVLLVGAGLMIRSFVALQAINPGFNPRHLLSMVVDVTSSRAGEPDQRASFYQQLLEQVRALPGIRSASAINHLPLAGDLWTRSFLIEGRPVPRPGEAPSAVYRVVLPRYFKTMDLPLLRGRGFNDSDNMSSQPVVVVNEELAKHFWPGENPIGKRIALMDSMPHARWLTVVGVTRNAKEGDWAATPWEEAYLPYLQATDYLTGTSSHFSYLTLVVRAAGDPASLAPTIRRKIFGLGKTITVSQVQTMEQVVADATAQPRFYLLMLGTFAAFAMVLAAIGIYGVMSYSVSRRTHEVGVRMALGAVQGDVLKLVISQGMTLALVGAAAGAIFALLLTHLMSSVLYGVQPTDPLTFVCVPLILLAVALVACYIPARRAAKVDPMVALRYE
jgi:putative ABC transport system permease protein